MRLVSAKIEDVCLVGDGAHASIKRVSKGVPYLTSKNFKKDGLDLSKLDYISEEDYAKHFNGKSKAITKPILNDIMLSIIGSIGSPHLVNNSEEFGLSSSVSILRPKEDKILPCFLYYWLKSDFFQTSIQQIKSGVAQSFLSLGMIRSLPVKYPSSLQTQKRIADILSAYDDLIENNLKRIKLLEQAAQNIYKEWFVHLRFPGHEKTPINEETGLPEGWRNIDLNEISLLKYGKMPKSEKKTDEGFVIFTGYREVGYYQEKMFDEPTLIIVARGVGGTGDVKISPRNCWLTNLSIAVINMEDSVSQAYLYYYLKLANLRMLDSGAAQSQITINSLKKVNIILPELDLQVKFQKEFDDNSSLIENLQKQNQKLKTARDILLPRLMNRTIAV